VKISNASSGAGTMGLAGTALMVLHITNQLTGWAWPLLYVLMIVMAIGQENRK
jgi:hypothetical protein